MSTQSFSSHVGSGSSGHCLLFEALINVATSAQLTVENALSGGRCLSNIIGVGAFVVANATLSVFFSKKSRNVSDEYIARVVCMFSLELH